MKSVSLTYGNVVYKYSSIERLREALNTYPDRVSEIELMQHADIVVDGQTNRFLKHRQVDVEMANQLAEELGF